MLKKKEIFFFQEAPQTLKGEEGSSPQEAMAIAYFQLRPCSLCLSL